MYMLLLYYHHSKVGANNNGDLLSGKEIKYETTEWHYSKRFFLSHFLSTSPSYTKNRGTTMTTSAAVRGCYIYICVCVSVVWGVERERQ